MTVSIIVSYFESKLQIIGSPFQQHDSTDKNQSDIILSEQMNAFSAVIPFKFSLALTQQTHIWSGPPGSGICAAASATVRPPQRE